ncbi:MAG: fasciclin domain-containing protein [Deinococcota bacterium]|jgi:uncharacterized surface protein with fasciclin (FAS1) repeats|nr:fasciclin domain-containing protein [Deinococcota bacterium]
MTYRILPLLLGLLLTLLLTLAQATSEPAERPPASPLESPVESAAAEGSILDIIAADMRFSMLYEALDASGLLEALAAEGSFTLFAPTDEAFMLLPEAELADLMNDQEALLRVLRYHVAEGLFVHESLLEVTEMTTLEGDQVFITVAGQEDGAEMMVNEARFLDAGTLASNGVVYAVDAVLLPPAPNGSEASR